MRLGIAGAGMIVRGLFSFIHEIEGIELEAIASTEKSIEKEIIISFSILIKNYKIFINFPKNFKIV